MFNIIFAAQHISPETSPRGQPSQPLVKHSPRLEPITTTTNPVSHTPRVVHSPQQVVSHSPRANHVVHSPRQSTQEPYMQAVSTGTQDAAKSPVFDQAVQTGRSGVEIEFHKSGVIMIDFISFLCEQLHVSLITSFGQVCIH